jgi:bifunctional UDP-N-acetylglucosamine pyrophosphorylase/glucosamine-1-phosphate N-acetyltransferase
LLAHQLTQLDAWVEEAILVVGYRSEQIREHFGEQFRSVKLRYVHQQEQRGTADAVMAAREHVRGRTLIINGDDFYHRDDLRSLAATDTGRGLVVTHAPDPQNRAVVSIEDDAISNIVEKPVDPLPDAWCSVGGYCIERDDLRWLDELTLSPRGELELPDFIMMVARATRVRPHYLKRLWMPLTYSWDVLGIAMRIARETSVAADLGIELSDPKSLGDQGDVRLGSDVQAAGPVVCGPGVTISDGCRLEGPVLLGRGTRLEAGARVARLVALDGARIGEGANVSDSVLGENVTVGKGARLESRPAHELRVDVKGKVITPDLERLGAVLGDASTVREGVFVPAGTLADPETVLS